MNVLVDTSVWSLALRRREPLETLLVQELRELVSEGRARLIGPIRQEVLSGIRGEVQFRRLRESLRAFLDLELAGTDFERAAEFSNRCRRNGIQGSGTDFLICAAADHYRLPILTADLDFTRFAEHIPVRLHQPRSDLS